MWMAVIKGWTDIEAFSENEEKAKKLALKEKKRLCKDDLEKWTWETCDEYYGAYTIEIKEGLILRELYEEG